jgi:alpha-L-rhamnosidase
MLKIGRIFNIHPARGGQYRSMTSPFPEALWISSPIVGGPRTTAPAPFFRKPFVLPGGAASAKLRITALGLYECEINGRRVGDQIFTPGWTNYHVRVPFQEYDVTDLLQEGENVLGAVLGDGWYCGFMAWKERQLYGDRPRLIARLDGTAHDGSAFAVVTDGSWHTRTAAILESDFQLGETYDARLEVADWSQAGCDARDWHPVEIASDPKISFETPRIPPVRRIAEIAPVQVTHIPKHWPKPCRIFDLGQNFSGRARITVTAPRGTTFSIRFGEVLSPDGTVYQANLRSARSTEYYTCRGGGEETWEPCFTFHGFRYVEIRGLAPEHPIAVTGVVLHSDLKPTGSFACSNPLLNKLQENIVWSQRSNFLEVPTDCPQRNERMGWTGDAQVFARTACFNMDVREFFHKWMQDFRDAQRPNGAIPAVIPEPGVIPFEEGGPAWADATIICPWTIYLCYGDREILADHYDSMKAYMDFVIRERSLNHIRSHPDVDPWGGYGDWLALDGSGGNEGSTPRDLIGTAFHANNARIMSRIAGLLGHHEEAEKYQTLHTEIVQAFQRRFLTPEGLLASGTQTSYVLALYFGLVPKNLRPFTAGELVRQIRKRDFHLATGFVGTPHILDVLATHGHLDVAYKLLEQESFPSWLFPVKNGATTIWERWDSWTPKNGMQDPEMNSFNHYAYGAVGAFMVRTVAGLEIDPEDPGYRHIIFQPQPGGSLEWAEARLDTDRGPVSIRWEREGESLNIDLEIPEGSTATLKLPDGTVQEGLQPGIYRHQFRQPVA